MPHDVGYWNGRMGTKKSKPSAMVAEKTRHSHPKPQGVQVRTSHPQAKLRTHKIMGGSGPTGDGGGNTMGY